MLLKNAKTYIGRKLHILQPSHRMDFLNWSYANLVFVFSAFVKDLLKDLESLYSPRNPMESHGKQVFDPGIKFWHAMAILSCTSLSQRYGFYYNSHIAV